MIVAETRAQLARALEELRAGGRRIALVPTRGFLHEGHLSLVDRAREEADEVVVSIFVNPLQFGPGEDLESYPRDRERDLALLEARGASLAFVPSASFLVHQRQRAKSGWTTWIGIAPAGDGLPHAEREVRRIASQWEGATQIRHGREATVAATLNALQQADVVHIAAHARMNERFPLYAHLALYDRRLELHELMHQRIDARLVVLSACETGHSAGTYDPIPTSADHVSFPRAFLTAGAGAVIATHWPVGDAEMVALMKAFYEQVRSQGPSLAEALAHAQRPHLQARRDAQIPPHPFYWAGVSLFGDGR